MHPHIGTLIFHTPCKMLYYKQTALYMGAAVHSEDDPTLFLFERAASKLAGADSFYLLILQITFYLHFSAFPFFTQNMVCFSYIPSCFMKTNRLITVIR